jgi:tetratricopeptide (TPR) repeat protein
MGEPAEALKTLETVRQGGGDAGYRAEAGQLLARGYERTGPALRAAQAWQALAEAPGVEAPTVGRALARAGEIFLNEAMPEQALEAGLRALILESQLGAEPDKAGWGGETGDALRLVLARAYAARGDWTRAVVTMQDYLARAGVQGEQRVGALRELADYQEAHGRRSQALATLKSVGDEADAAPVVRRAADQTIKILQWDQAHPQWSVR